MPEISRGSVEATIRIADDIADCEPISFSEYSGGVLFVPAAETPTTLTLYAGDSTNFATATYMPLLDYAGDPVVLVAAGGECIEIHPAAFGALSLKILAGANSAGDYIDYPITLKV